jgi:hypothetical protein
MYAWHSLLHAAHGNGSHGVFRLAGQHQGNQRLEPLVSRCSLLIRQTLAPHCVHWCEIRLPHLPRESIHGLPMWRWFDLDADFRHRCLLGRGTACFLRPASFPRRCYSSHRYLSHLMLHSHRCALTRFPPLRGPLFITCAQVCRVRDQLRLPRRIYIMFLARRSRCSVRARSCPRCCALRATSCDDPRRVLGDARGSHCAMGMRGT